MREYLARVHTLKYGLAVLGVAAGFRSHAFNYRTASVLCNSLTACAPPFVPLPAGPTSSIIPLFSLQLIHVGQQDLRDMGLTYMETQYDWRPVLIIASSLSAPLFKVMGNVEIRSTARSEIAHSVTGNQERPWLLGPSPAHRAHEKGNSPIPSFSKAWDSLAHWWNHVQKEFPAFPVWVKNTSIFTPYVKDTERDNFFISTQIAFCLFSKCVSRNQQ